MSIFVPPMIAHLRGVRGSGADNFTQLSVPPRTTVQTPGAGSSVAYLIESGAVKIVVTTQNGRDAIIGLRRAGVLLNAAAVLANTQSLSSIVTVTASRLVAMPRPVLLAEMQCAPSFAKLVHEAVASDTDELYAALGAAMAEAASDRLWHLLTQLSAAMDGEAGEFSRVLPWLTRDEMAESIGCTRVYLSKLLARFERDGLLQRRRGWILIRTEAGGTDRTARFGIGLENAK